MYLPTYVKFPYLQEYLYTSKSINISIQASLIGSGIYTYMYTYIYMETWSGSVYISISIDLYADFSI